MKLTCFRIALLVCVLFSSQFVFSQNGIVRVREYSFGAENISRRILTTTDGNYVALHYSQYNSNSAIIKYDPSFNTLWTADVGVNVEDIIETSDEGIIGCGVRSFGRPDVYSEEFWIIKLNKSGVVQWQKNYGGMKQDYAHAIRQKPNGNYVICGITNSVDGDVIGKTIADRGDAWVIELDGSGNLVNQQLLDVPGADSYYSSLDVTPEGGVIVATSNTIGVQPSDIIVYKLAPDLTVQWSKTIGGAGDDIPNSIFTDAVGDYILGGRSNSTSGDIIAPGTYNSGFVMKLDPLGNTRWTKVFAGNYYDEVMHARPISGNDIIVVGHAGSEHIPGIPKSAALGWIDAMLVRLDANGNMTWSRRIGANDFDNAFDVAETPFNSFVIAGSRIYASTGGDYTGILTPGFGDSRGFIMEVRNFTNKIKGVVYLDANNNRIFDAGEAYDAAPVNVAKGSFQINDLPVQGNFSLSLDTGVYVTRLKHEGVIDTSTFGISPKRKRSTLTMAGQVDSFPIRILPIDLVEDLEISISRISFAWLDHAVRYRLRLRNHGGKTISNAQVKLKLDNTVTYQSSTFPLSTTIGDTLVWNYPSFPGLYKDSFDITLFTKTVPQVLPLAITRLQAIAEPYTTDFDTLDNIATNESVIFGQNAAISSIQFSASANDSARINRTIPYGIVYFFSSWLDSTKGVVRLVKDPNMSFVSATPAPASIDNDTLIWNFKDLSFNNQDTILVNLKTIDSGGLNIGDHIHLSGQLRFLTADTAELVRNFHLSKVVTGYYVDPDNTNTPLQPPHGIRWTRSFGGTNEDVAADVVALPDSGFIVVGHTSSNNLDIGSGSDTSTNGFFARFDKDGHVVWKQVSGGPVTDALSSITMASPGIFYAAGIVGNSVETQAWIIKFNINGEILWSKTYGGSATERARSVLATEDGGCIFAGLTTSSDGDVHGNEPNPIADRFPGNLWLVKLDANGTLQWDSCYFGTAHAYDAMDLKKTKDNKLIVGGAALGVQGFSMTVSGLLFMLNNDGTRVLEKIYHIPGLNRRVYSVVVNDDNSFILAGEAVSPTFTGADTTYSGVHGAVDIWATKVDNSGSTIWEKYFGGSEMDAIGRMILTSDSNYVVAATSVSNNGNVTGLHGTRPDGWLLKISPAGNLIWQKTIGGTSTEVLNSVAELGDRSLMAVGYTSNDGEISGYRGGISDMFLAKVGVSNFITGTVYIDLNNNGTKEPDEPYFKKGIVNATGSRNYSGVVFDGLYQVSVDTGDYVLKFYTADSAYYNVVPATANVSFDGLSQTATVDFRLVRKADINDLRLAILPVNIVRPGFTADFRIQYENKGTIESAPVTIRIKMDPNTSYKSSSIPVSSTVGDTLVWDLAGPDILETASFDLVLNVKPPPDVNLNDTLRFYGEILPIEIDSTPLNNIAEVKIVVRGAYDPNDKIEVHGNTLPYNFVENDEYLTYVIRFQNTGTDTAFNVYVRDTLSNKFDWNTFEMIDASHVYELTVQDGNKIEWYFRDIYLPDSNINEPASHGFIAFRIKLRQDIEIGDSITNDAGIYFDFNLPVQTNLMLSTIGPASALPSTILKFTASWKQETSAQLKWHVTNEYKVAYYEVQHSGNGIQFNAAGQVTATNEHGDHSYEYIHDALLYGTNYYRLKIVDIDGKIAYSKIVTLKKETDLVATLKIYPVPAGNEPITILIEGKVKGIGTLSIYSIDGKLITARQLGILDRQNYRYTIDASTLGKGVYMLNCTIGDRTYRGKLIIQ